MTQPVSALKILMVEDMPSDAEITLRELKRSGLDFEHRRVETEAELMRECVEFAPDIVLSDFALPHFDGLSALGVVRRLRPDLPFIFVSGTIGEETAIESLRGGANDYVLKTNLPRLPTAVRRALKDAAERAVLRETEEALRLRDRAVEASVNAVMIVSAADSEMPLVYVNRAFERTTGYGREEVIGRNCRFLQGADRDQPELEKIRRAIAEQHDAQALLRNYRKDGSLFWNMLYVTPVHDPRSGAVTHFVGVQYDITEIKRYQDELEHQANHDALTGLANRNLLRDRLQQSLALAHRYERPFSLAFIDLDNFKLVNDSLGHDIGDRLLKIAGERLVSCVREGDTVARLGGDEFVLLITEQDRDDSVYRIVQRVMAEISQPFVIDQREFKVTCSVGIANFPRDGEDADTLLRNADTAMYRAKDLGRNTFQLYSSEMNANFGERLTLETDLWNALERDEFVLHYQPKVDLKTGRIIGMEALLRWQHPVNGMIPPGKFIPVAEESSLIVQIGKWVLREACRQNQAWQDDGLRYVPIAVNISARQLHDKDLIETVRTTLESTRLRAEYLEIELTESAVMLNTDQTINTMSVLRGMDVRISLDDFGTGYSSLSYLKRFPVTGLKIDQSFVRDIAYDPDDAAIVRAIVAVAQELMLDVTAEGVETVEQLEFLKAHGCGEAQGYYFARPAPASEIRALLERGSLPAA
ncbi:MAG: EAL domain-containing protein [Betaproteobacteria bacterium]|nr:MAG: EAL domain-containing protein [Betaproteobacteria bacterium]